MSILTFSYGSNLDAAQMRRRCPSARPFAGAALEGYRLAFAGHSRVWGGPVATVVPATKGRVRGMLYAVSIEELLRLDAFEGCPHAYRRARLRVRDELGRFRRAEVYVMGARRPQGEPPTAYLVSILRAYERLGWSRLPLLRAAFGRDE